MNKPEVPPTTRNLILEAELLSRLAPKPPNPQSSERRVGDISRLRSMSKMLDNLATGKVPVRSLTLMDISRELDYIAERLESLL